MLLGSVHAASEIMIDFPLYPRAELLSPNLMVFLPSTPITVPPNHNLPNKPLSQPTPSSRHSSPPKAASLPQRLHNPAMRTANSRSMAAYSRCSRRLGRQLAIYSGICVLVMRIRMREGRAGCMLASVRSSIVSFGFSYFGLGFLGEEESRGGKETSRGMGEWNTNPSFLEHEGRNSSAISGSHSLFKILREISWQER